MDGQGKIIPMDIHSGGSIGPHTQETSDNINYILSGTGKAICNGADDLLHALGARQTAGAAYTEK